MAQQDRKITKDQLHLIMEIADRAITQAAKQGVWLERLDVMMDLTAAHEAIPLRLGDLLAADDANFAHDIGGIRRHLNRETREIENYFCPRFAA